MLCVKALNIPSIRRVQSSPLHFALLAVRAMGMSSGLVKTSMSHMTVVYVCCTVGKAVDVVPKVMWQRLIVFHSYKVKLRCKSQL